MDSLSDEKLVELYRETGESRPFEILVHRYIGKVRGMIYNMVLNDMDADDITQDVFIRAAKGVSGFWQRAGFSTWLYRIAMNSSKSFLKKRNRNPIVTSDEPPQQVDLSPGPDGAMITAEECQSIAAALANLSTPLRAAITLTVINGLTPEEAAKAEGCMTATIYWRIHEARKLLRERLNFGNESQVSNGG